MTSVSSRTPVVPSNAPTRPKLGPITRGSLRSIIAPKPRLTTATADAAFPTRIPIRKKRDHGEIAPDENDSARDARQAHLRQRCDSGSSVRTLTRERTTSQDSIAPGARPRTSSQESVRTIKNIPVSKAAACGATPPGAPALAKSCGEPVHGTLSRSERVSAIASITRTAAALRRTTDCNKAIREGGVNTLRFPSDATAVPVARTRADLAQERIIRKPDATPERPAKSLRRTQSHRKLFVDESEKDCDRLDKVCEASPVEAYEAQVDEVLDEIRRAKAALDEEEEAVVRQVVNDIIEDPEVAAEAEALARSPKGRIIMDDLEEIPDMFSDEEDDPKAQPGEPAQTIPSPTSPDWMFERFDVMIKPTSKHTTMWDVNYECVVPCSFPAAGAHADIPQGYLRVAGRPVREGLTAAPRRPPAAACRRH